MTSAHNSAVSGARGGIGPDYLREVEGLRAVAALLVAVYHIWVQRVSGGVDVFFVVAAYFMTRSLAKHQRLALSHIGAYYISTLRRIVPGLVPVVTVTLALVLALLPASSWESEVRHAVASLLFVENWYLSSQASDYLSQDLGASAFQQIWALSLQVQLYLFFPVVFLLSRRIGGMFSIGTRDTASLYVTTALFALSLTWSIFETENNQPRAYFDTLARIWEFSAGVILALTIDRFSITATLSKVLGTLALVVLVSFASLVDVSSEFPGAIAAVPVSAAVLIIVAAYNRGELPILTWRHVVEAGEYSFSFYLWHWPLLVVTRSLLQSQDIGLLPGLIILIVSGALAWASTHLLETPFRRSAYLTKHPAWAVFACVAAATPAAVSVLAAVVAYSHKRDRAQAQLAKLQASPGEFEHAPNILVPDPVIVRGDVPAVYADRCHQTIADPALIECIYGNKRAGRVLVLVGGSHSAQWLPALQSLAEARGYKIISMTKSACYFSLGADVDALRDASCSLWNETAVNRIKAISPDLVVTIATRPVAGKESTPAGYVRAWRTLGGVGIKVLALRDNPWFDDDPVRCAEYHVRSVDDCGSSRDEHYSKSFPGTIPTLSNVQFADFSDQYCPGGFCPVARNGILRYRDRHHLTKTYVLMLRGRLDEAIKEALGSSNRPAQPSL